MKKFVLAWAFILPLIFAGCSDDDEKEISFSLSDDYISLRVDEEYLVSSSKEATWACDNPFVISANTVGYYPNLRIKAEHVGKATLAVVTREGEKGECVVEVLPVYTTYREPVLQFGASKATIKSKENRVLIQEKSNSLGYQGEDKAVQAVLYLFENNKMTSAAVAVSFSKTEEVTKFLLERYQPIGEEDGMFLFINNEIKKADMGVALTVQDSYLMIMYVPYEDMTKAAGSGDKFSRLKAAFAEELAQQAANRAENKK